MGKTCCRCMKSNPYKLIDGNAICINCMTPVEHEVLELKKQVCEIDKRMNEFDERMEKHGPI